MKVLKAEVDWMYGYSNGPSMRILVDSTPPIDSFRFSYENGLYFAVNEGLVSFYAYRSPGKGFGGAVFNITMKDGTKRALKGPWSSRSSCINTYTTCEMCNEVGYTSDPEVWDRGYTFYAGAVTIPILLDACKLARVNLAMEKFGDELTFTFIDHQHPWNFKNVFNNRQFLGIIYEA